MSSVRVWWRCRLRNETATIQQLNDKIVQLQKELSQQEQRGSLIRSELDAVHRGTDELQKTHGNVLREHQTLLRKLVYKYWKMFCLQKLIILQSEHVSKHGAQCDFMKHCGTSWSTVGLHEAPWDFMKHSGTSWSTVYLYVPDGTLSIQPSNNNIEIVSTPVYPGMQLNLCLKQTENVLISFY